MRLVYFDCFSGASGDMILGALLDAGADESAVRTALGALPMGGWELEVDEVTRRGVRAKKANVTITEGTAERTFSDIEELIEGADLDDAIRRRSVATVRLLAEAEARVHGGKLSHVHLHEVGALDAIVDIVGSCTALESLAPDRLLSSPIATGRGFVESAHGRLPVTSPAVTEILRDAVLYERGSFELITPTGAALLAANCDGFSPLPAMRLRATGYGAGARDQDDVPNVLRVLIGDEDESAASGSGPSARLIETNIDDLNPEIVPYVIERLLAAGAYDAWAAPVTMKKGRSALMLSVLAEPSLEPRLLDIVFKETTTLGIRLSTVERAVLDRKEIEVEVAGHRVRIKIGLRDGDAITAAPEFEDAAEAARATGLPLKDVYDLARRSVPPETAL